jgi:Uma2 family endonuclease
MSVTLNKLVTADELLAMGDIGRCELVRGEVIPMAPAGENHGQYGMRLAWRLAAFIEENNLGETYLAETGFLLAVGPDTVRAPDFAFVPTDRVQHVDRGFSRSVPQMVLEVLSPDDAAVDVEEKVQEWLAFGVTSVWVANPRTKSVTIHRSGQNQSYFKVGDVLADPAAVPGFSVEVAKVFR